VKTTWLIALLVVAAGGCSAAGAPSVTPATPSAAPTASPTPSTPPAATPGSQPPDAVLGVDGGAPSKGELGTYTWLSAGSDAPWLPGTPVKAQPGAAATIVLEPPAAIATWSIRKAKPGASDETTAREIAAGSGPIIFSVPADAGTMVLQVQFAANAGDANYFWALSPG
jgi:hypothetical protein